ncbi:unnamed protein product [Peniophora sp. CBMAI 1063]|nr:unnamed protein product [Peniophora sp. CBMAI 1063]
MYEPSISGLQANSTRLVRRLPLGPTHLNLFALYYILDMDPTYTQLQMRLYKRELSEYTYRLYDKARSDMQAKGLTYLPPTPMVRGPLAAAPATNTPVQRAVA